MTARDDLLQLFADWGVNSGKGARERADRILAKHQTEVRAATLAEADAAITAAIERDRALFPARSSDRAALGAAREIIRNLAATAGRPALPSEQQTALLRLAAEALPHRPLADVEWPGADPADCPAAAADVRGGFWPGMTGGLCSVCHIAELRGGQANPDCADCRTVAADRPLTRVRIDLNVHLSGGCTRAAIEECDGPVTVGQPVEVYEDESGLRGPGRVSGINDATSTVYLWVDWPRLRVPADRPAADTQQQEQP